MSEFDDLDDIQLSFGKRDSYSRWGVSPALARAKVARPVKSESSGSPSPPPAIPESQQPPASAEPRLIRSMRELVEALKAAQAERGISQATLCSISGLADGYIGKLFGPKAAKGLGYESLGLVMQALGKQIVLIDDPDPERIAKVKDRWMQSKR